MQYGTTGNQTRRDETERDDTVQHSTAQYNAVAGGQYTVMQCTSISHCHRCLAQHYHGTGTASHNVAGSDDMTGGSVEMQELQEMQETDEVHNPLLRFARLCSAVRVQSPY